MSDDLLLIHWNEAEARERAERLRELGHGVRIVWQGDYRLLREIAADPPRAVVIDLGRLPSQGREVGVALRTRKATRFVPLVFVDGAAEKVARVRELLPDASYASWEELDETLHQTLAAHPLADPKVPAAMSAYRESSLPRKLGIRAEDRVLAMGTPPELEATLGELPPGAVLRRRAGSAFRLVLLFASSGKELERRFPNALRSLDEGGSLWICWPKKASGVASDLGGNEVRAFGLDHGLVDFKIASIDATWSGLRFARRSS